MSTKTKLELEAAEAERAKAQAAEAEQEDSATAAAEIVKGSPEWYEQLVPVRLFRDSGRYKDDVFVAVNGKGWLIKRGEEVEIPRYVAQVLYASLNQDTAAAELMERESARFQSESERLWV